MIVVPADNRGAPGVTRARAPKFYVVSMPAEDGKPATSMFVRALTAQGARMALVNLIASTIAARLATPEELLAAGAKNARIVDACKPEQAALLDPGSSAAELVAAGAPQAA